MSDLQQLDREHVWHPFTPMQQWCESEQLIIERAEGYELIDTQGRRYIDGVSSLWCNVHGHRVEAIDRAIVAQLGKVAHSTLLGLGGEQSILLAAELVKRCAVLAEDGFSNLTQGPLRKVFYSDAGATAVEAALKMAVGYWHNIRQPEKRAFIAIGGAYHGDTVGSMSVGFSDFFHRAYKEMVFPVQWAPAPDVLRLQKQIAPSWKSSTLFPSQDESLCAAVKTYCLNELENLLKNHAHETAAIIIEPLMQGAAGMISQPAGYLRGVADLAKKYSVLLIADEVATGFGRTGKMFACEYEGVSPDILCLAKGITGGYLPLAATLSTNAIYDSYCGELSERKTFYHGHTYTGNALACAAALASIKLFDSPTHGSSNLIQHIEKSSQIISQRLSVLQDEKKFPHVVDVRQRGLMVGIELARDRATREPFDSTKMVGAKMCQAMRAKGLIIRPLGSVIVLMPIPGMDHARLERMMDVVVEGLQKIDEC